MATPKVSVDFSRYSDSELVPKAQSIVTNLTGNTNYTTPTPTLASVTTAINAFSAALAKAETGNSNDTLDKNQKRKILTDLLVNLGYYVQLNGKNDARIMGTSGYDLQKERSTIGILAKPENLKLDPKVGAIKISVDVVKGASSYNFNYTPMPVTPESVWLVQSSTSKSTLIENLTSGVQYAFQVCGVGSNPTRVYSNMVNCFVL